MDYPHQAEEQLRAKYEELGKELLDIKTKCTALEEKLAEAEVEREVRRFCTIIFADYYFSEDLNHIPF
jgi:phage shock protein A